MEQNSVFSKNSGVLSGIVSHIRVYHFLYVLANVRGIKLFSELSSKLCFELAEAIRRIGSRSVGDCTPTVWSDRTRRLQRRGISSVLLYIMLFTVKSKKIIKNHIFIDLTV